MSYHREGFLPKFGLGSTASIFKVVPLAIFYKNGKLGLKKLFYRKDNLDYMHLQTIRVSIYLKNFY